MKGKTIATSLLALVASASAFAQVPVEVPELTAFHSVIVPLWHTAWPKKDLQLMRELLPRIKDHLGALQRASLPGILRDKQARWDEGVKGMAAASAAMEQALTNNHEQAALDAAERLHSGFEGLVRAIRPPMKELDVYHQVLYQIFHRDWPEKKFDSLKTNAALLAIHCQALQGASVPERAADRAESVKASIGALCASTTALVDATQTADPAILGKAVTQVHADYQAIEKLLE